jgi:hypothetical protein
MALLDFEIPELDLPDVPLEILIDQERRRREKPPEGIPLYVPLPDYREIPPGYSPENSGISDDGPGYIEIDL